MKTFPLKLSLVAVQRFETEATRRFIRNIVTLNRRWLNSILPAVYFIGWLSMAPAAAAPLTIISSTPPDGYVDPLEDKDASGNCSGSDTSGCRGIQDITVTFSEPVSAGGGGLLTAANFKAQYFRAGVEVPAAHADLATGLAPSMTLTGGSGAGPYTLRFSPRIPLGAWTEIEAINVVNAGGLPISTGNRDNKRTIGFLPIDTTQDGRILGDDITRWLQVYTGTYIPPSPLGPGDFCDQKRNGITAGEDITRAIQLINGTGTFQPWNAAAIGPMPGCSLPEGLVAYYPFEGSMNDASGHAALNGSCSPGTCPQVAAGKVGLAYSFDGVDDRIVVPSNSLLDLSSDMTVALWLSTPVILQWQTPLFKGINPDVNGGNPRAYSIYLWKNAAGTGSNPRLTWYNGGWKDFVANNVSLLPNSWYHVAYTRSGGTETLYVNGAPVAGPQPTASGIIVNNQPLSIGGSGAPLEMFNGLVDEVVVFNRGLSQGEIQSVSLGLCGGGGSFSSGSSSSSSSSSAGSTPPLTFSRVVVEHGSTAPANIWGKAVGDLNGDGKSDFVVGGNGAGGLVWYQAPDWQKHTIDSAAGYSTDIEVADMDRDGDNDVVTVRSGPLYLWRNSNWGTSWIAPVTVIGSATYHDVEVADFNADGLPDIVARNQGGSGNHIDFYFQQAGRTWPSSPIVIPTGTSGSSEGLKVADINDDGRPDVVAGPTWFENTASTTNWPAHIFAANWTHLETYVAVCDVNRDGRLDIALSPSEAQGGSYFIAWYEAPLDRTQSWTPHIVDPSVETVHHFIDCADFDGDGDIDVASAEMHQGADPDEVKIYTQAGGTWTKNLLVNPTTQRSMGSHSMKVVDADNDGDPDLLGTNHNSAAPMHDVELWVNNTMGPLPLETNWGYITVDSARTVRAFGFAAGDFTADGYKDLVSGPYFYKNPGGSMSGTWSRQTLPGPSGVTLDALLVTDADSDSLRDIVAADRNGGVYWLEPADTSASFWSRTAVGNINADPEGISTQGYALGELFTGGSGKKEIVLGSAPNLFAFQIPQSPAQPWTRVTITASSNGEGVCVGDIDRDGLTDVCGGKIDGRTVAWWKNPGTLGGTWQEYAIGQLPGTEVDRIYAADLDRDGKLDIVTTLANGSANGIYWLTQPSDPRSPAWAVTRIAAAGAGLQVGASANSLDVGDIDRDGDLDLAVAEHLIARPRLLIFENRNNGASWVIHVADDGTTGPSKEQHLGSRLVDLDHDGDLDIAGIAFTNYQYLHLWRNDALPAPSSF